LSIPYSYSKQEEVDPDFSSSPHKNKQQLIKDLQHTLSQLKTRHSLTDHDILGLLHQQKQHIPLSIFSTKLSPLEALVKYLKDHQHHTNHAIAELLNRNDRTIWTTYNNAKQKNITLPLSTDILLPFSLFSDRTLSILEHVVKYLKEQLYMTNKKIANLLNKDNRTIWTVYDRSKKKQKT